MLSPDYLSSDVTQEGEAQIKQIITGRIENLKVSVC